jgi:hypothetical protein
MYSVTKKERTGLLNKIAYKKEIPQSDLEEKGKKGKSYRNILRQLQFLEKGDFIKVRIEPRERGKKGPGKNIWSITFKGLIHALLNNNTFEDFETILRAHPDMLLIARKLDLFETSNVKDDVLDILKNILDYDRLETAQLHMQGLPKKIYPSDEAWQNKFDTAILHILLIEGFGNIPPATYKTLLISCMKDKELKAFILKMVKTEIKRYDATVSFKEAWDKAGVAHER